MNKYIDEPEPDSPYQYVLMDELFVFCEVGVIARAASELCNCLKKGTDE